MFYFVTVCNSKKLNAMKKILLLVLISITGVSFAQKKMTDEERDLSYAKRVFDAMKTNKVEPKDELLWKFTYGDTSKTALTKIGKTLEKENLTMGEVVKSTKDPKKYTITLTEVKKYKTPQALSERIKYLNDIVHIFKIVDEEATVGAEKQAKTEDIKSYKKVKN